MLVHALQLTSLSVKLSHKASCISAKAWNQSHDAGYILLQECAFDNCLQQCRMDTVAKLITFKQLKVYWTLINWLELTFHQSKVQ